MRLIRRLSAIASAIVLTFSAFPAEAADVIGRVPGLTSGVGIAAPAAPLIAAPSAGAAPSPLLGAPAVAPLSAAPISAAAPSAAAPSATAAAAASDAPSSETAAAGDVVAAEASAPAAAVPAPVVAAAEPQSLPASASALFDGSQARASAPDGVREGDAAPKSFSPASLSRGSLSRRLLGASGKKSVLARAGGALARVPVVSSFWHLYRDGVLAQHYAERLSSKASSTRRRVGAARVLAVLGGVNSVPLLGEIATGDADARVRHAAQAALLHLAAAATPSLIRTLKTNVFSLSRETAAISLGWIARHSDAPAALDALGVTALMDSAEGVRLASIQSLAGARSPKVASTLGWLQVVEHRPYMRASVERALADVRARHLEAGTAHLAPPSEDLPLAANPLHAAALKSSILVGLVFAVLQFGGGVMTDTLALKIDALGLAGDRALDAAALFAIWLARRPPTSRKTYGWLKAESVISFVGALVLAAMALAMTPGVIASFLHPVAVRGWSVLGFAALSVASNLFSAAMLRHHQGEHQGVRGAFLHAITDALGTVGIMIAAAASLLWGWSILIPVATAVLVVLVLRVAWELGKPAWNVLLDSAPDKLDMDALESDLAALPGVANVYDLHVRSLNSLGSELAAKLYVQPGADSAAVLASANAFLRERYGIVHSTIQIEPLPAAS